MGYSTQCNMLCFILHSTVGHCIQKTHTMHIIHTEELVECQYAVQSNFPVSIPVLCQVILKLIHLRKTLKNQDTRVKRMGVRGGWLDRSVGGSRGVLVGTQSRWLDRSRVKSPSFFNPHPTPSFFLCNEYLILSQAGNVGPATWGRHNALSCTTRDVIVNLSPFETMKEKNELDGKNRVNNWAIQYTIIFCFKCT